MHLINERLAQLYLDSDLSRRAFAAKLSCTESALSRWLDGSRMPSSLAVRATAKRFNVTADWLLAMDKD